MFLSVVFTVLGLLGSNAQDARVLEIGVRNGGSIVACAQDSDAGISVGSLCVTGLSDAALEVVDDELSALGYAYDSVSGSLERAECAFYGDIEGSKLCPSVDEQMEGR